MNIEQKKRTNMALWIIVTIFITAIVSFSIAGLLHQSESTNISQVGQKTDSSAALKDCIAQNVTPLQQGAGIDPYQAEGLSNAASVALESCKAQYPTQ